PLDEPLGDLERAAVLADVLAHHEDGLVALHLLPQGFCDRDEVRGLAGVGALAAGLGAVPCRAGLDLLALRALRLLLRALGLPLRLRGLLRGYRRRRLRSLGVRALLGHQAT